MAGSPEFQIPDELALLEFFGSEPIEWDDGLRVYELRSLAGVVLRFSFDIFERSVQTHLSTGDAVLSVVSHENAARMWIDTDGLHVDFVVSTTRTRLHLTSDLHARWSTLRVE